MLDIKFIIEDPAAIKEVIKRKKNKADIDQIVTYEQRNQK
jgi:seryl-tRNA synthetase